MAHAVLVETDHAALSILRITQKVAQRQFCTQTNLILSLLGLERALKVVNWLICKFLRSRAGRIYVNRRLWFLVTAHQEHIISISFISEFHGRRYRVQLKQTSHTIVIKALSFEYRFQFATLFNLHAFNLSETFRIKHMFSPQSFQFLLLTDQEIFTSLNTLYQLFFKFLLGDSQVLNLKWHLIVINLQTIPFMLCHSFT